MVITNSPRLRTVSRVCRLFPPAVSARIMNRFFVAADVPKDGITFTASSSLAPLKFEYSGRDDLALKFAIRGFLDWRNVVVVNRLCSAGDTIVEVGAHLGTETILFAAIVGREGRLVSFEPVPSHVAHLRKMLDSNGLAQAEVVQAAVSNKAGRVSFYMAPDDHNQGQGSMYELDEGKSEKIEVDCVTLDDFCGPRNLTPRLIAMDAEGAEFEVIQGAARVLAEARPYVLLEYNTEQIKHRGLSGQSFARLLRDAGYDCYRIARFGLERAEFDQFMNVIGIPNDDPVRAREDYQRVNGAIFWAGVLPVWRGLNPAIIGRR